MTKKQCWRYKCDHCGRIMYSSTWMRSHEIGCTANPNRTCRMPVHDGGNGQEPIAALIACLQVSGIEDHGLARLREMSDNCPACILAAIRQSGIEKPTIDDDGYSAVDLGFKFKEELAAMWSEVNSDRAAEHSAMCGYGN